MIIAAVADTHGKTESIVAHLMKVRPDYLLFAGDFYKDGITIAKKLHIPAAVVAGNSDTTNRSQQEQVISLLNTKFLLVHGHQYGVKSSLNRLYYYAQQLGVDAVVFGHTHNPFCERLGGLWMINPGSPVRPRLNGPGSYVLIEIEEGKLNCQIQRLEVAG